MTILCKLCRGEISSDLPAEQLPIKHVMETMSSHLVASHNKAAAELATEVTLASTLIASYLLISRYVDIPAGETELLKTLDETEDTLLEIMNVEMRSAN